MVDNLSGDPRYDEEWLHQGSQHAMHAMTMGQQNKNGGGRAAGGQFMTEIVSLDDNPASVATRRKALPEIMPQTCSAATLDRGISYHPNARCRNNILTLGGEQSLPDSRDIRPHNPSKNMDENATILGNIGLAQGFQTQKQTRRQVGGTELSMDTVFPENQMGCPGMFSAATVYTFPTSQASEDMDIDRSILDPSLMTTDYNFGQCSLGQTTNIDMGSHIGCNVTSSLGGDTNDEVHDDTDGNLAGRVNGNRNFDADDIQNPVNSNTGSSQMYPGIPKRVSGSVPMFSQYGHVSRKSRGSSAHFNRKASMPGEPFQPSKTSSSQDEFPRSLCLGSEPSNLSKQVGRPSDTISFQIQPQNPVSGYPQDHGVQWTEDDVDCFNMCPSTESTQRYSSDQDTLKEFFSKSCPPTIGHKPHMQYAHKNAYSSTGFDMLGVLTRVATRPNPEINIGSVDLSCAFLVCDAELPDLPIVYCSDSFERLTGYTKHMVLGRNCRFMQSPDGNVAAGVRRKYVDDNSVLYLKNMINRRQESQITLINYRRGGQPFMNLLTTIPITWHTEQVKFFVGFQVDLVEQPNAVVNENPNGSYAMNYQRDLAMPPYAMIAPRSKPELGQTVSNADVSAMLHSIGSGEPGHTESMWHKALVEIADDVIQIISPKGLIKWVSPSTERVLEYEPHEIIGSSLSSLCHPSDIVPVTRELRDASAGAPINIILRIRRKRSGYMWFEDHGSRITEDDKGHKLIIMVGREHTVYTLSKHVIASAGGVNENELWSKVSISGMLLYVSANVQQILGHQAGDLIGVSFQSLIHAQQKKEFDRTLRQHARTGNTKSVEHELIGCKGQRLSALTTLYTGGASDGMKPTFIVAKTRLIKYSLSSQSTGLNTRSRARTNLNEHQQTTTSTNEHLGEDGSDDNHPSHASGSNSRKRGHSATMYTSHSNHDFRPLGRSLESNEEFFEELEVSKPSSWQYELRHLERRNRMLAREVQSLIAAKMKRKGVDV